MTRWVHRISKKSSKHCTDMEMKKMSEYKKKIIELIESNLTGYEISKKTGVSQYVLSQLRQGKREVDNLTLNTTEKLYEYANKVL